MRTRALAICVALAACVLAATAHAEFPDKPVRFVVPFPAGGGKDLGQQVLIDIRAGAGTVIGTENALKSPPDGYTILMASFAHSINPSLVAKLPYDPGKLTYIAMIGRFANSVVIPPDRPFKTMAELIAYAKANPGKLNYGSFGNGTSPHMFPELLKSMMALDITHVPYKGAAPAIIDLLGGRLDMIFSTSASAASHVRSGKLLLVAVTSAARSSFYPDVPTVAEAGVPGYDAVAWYGVLAPPGLSADIAARLTKSVMTAANTDLFQRRAKEDGIEIDLGGPEKLGPFMRSEEERWRKVVQQAKIKPD